VFEEGSAFNVDQKGFDCDQPCRNLKNGKLVILYPNTTALTQSNCRSTGINALAMNWLERRGHLYKGRPKNEKARASGPLEPISASGDDLTSRRGLFFWGGSLLLALKLTRHLFAFGKLTLVIAAHRFSAEIEYVTVSFVMPHENLTYGIG
jgi:hypothetical protein